MPDSEWIVFLPLVGAILGAVVGKVGGAWANSCYRDREAKKAEDQERKGLLLLLNAEVFSHIRLIENALQNNDPQRMDKKSLSLTSWMKS